MISYLLFRGGLLVVPDAVAGAVACVPGPFHPLQLLYWISQVCVIDRHFCAFLFAQCTVDPKTGLVQNGMHTSVGAVRLRHLLGIWY